MQKYHLFAYEQITVKTYKLSYLNTFLLSPIIKFKIIDICSLW